MPQRARHPCMASGCVALVDVGRYCDDHQSHVGLDIARPSSHERGYGAAWRRLRKIALARSPLCADPFGEHAQRHEIVVATDVDHIISKRDGGGNEESNLQALCHSCHSTKTIQQIKHGHEEGRIKSLSLAK